MPVRNHFALLLFAALILLQAVIPACATVQDESLENYAQHVWQVQNGLPASDVQVIAQTPDGYLWVGTTGGLARFDGKSFTVFDSATNRLFRKIDGITALTVAKNGTLWIGTEGGGLIHYQHGHFTRYSAGEGFAVNFVRSIVEGDSGRVWFATYAGLFYLDDNKISPFQPVDALKGSLFTMVKDHFGTIWVGGEQLVHIHSGIATLIPLPESTAEVAITSLAANNNTLWIGCASGLYKLQLRASGSPGDIVKIPGDFGTIRALHVFPDGTLWIGTTNKGSFAYRDGILRRLVMPSPLPDNAVFWIFQDHQGDIWLGGQGGLVRLTPSDVTTLRLPDATNVDFQTLYSDPEGPLWVASSHLYQIQSGEAKQIQLPRLGGARVLTILRDHDGTLWIGTKGEGLFHIGKGIFKHYNKHTGLSNNEVRALLQGSTGDLWIGTASHLNILHNGVLETILGRSYSTTPAGIHVLFEDTHGLIWIGTDQGLFCWQNNHLVSNGATRGLTGFPVWSLFEDSRHALWIGTAGNGLFRWENDVLSHVDTGNKLLPNEIYSILQTKDNRVWISGPNGIYAIEQNDLNALADGVRYSPPVQFYSVPDGAYTAQIYGGYMQAGVYRPSGDLWYPSLNGPIHITTYQQNQPYSTPPVVLQKITANGRELPLIRTVGLDTASSHFEAHYSNIDLGTHASHIEIRYGAIDLRPQDELRYRYELKGFDTHWENSGLHKLAYYTNLPPGKYMFRVQAYRLDSPAIRSEADVSLILKAPFYLTWWFYTCCGILFLCVTWLIYREKMERYREKFRAVLEERTRVAREMHDTLLRGCTSVSSLLEALSSTKAVPDELKNTLLDPARLQMTSTIEEARRAIWGLRHEDALNPDLATLIQEASTRIGDQFAFFIECRVLGKPTQIRQDVSHHLIMVVSESLINSLRHGYPSKIIVVVKFGKMDVNIDISDDGQGFMMATELDRSKEKHYGITGMRERIEGIEGMFNIVTIPGKGTRISVRVPLRVCR